MSRSKPTKHELEMVVGSNGCGVPVKSGLKSRHVSPSVSWVVMMLNVCCPFLCCSPENHLVCLNSGLLKILRPICSGWGESVGMAWRATWESPLQVIINLFIFLRRGYGARGGLGPHFSFPPSFSVSYLFDILSSIQAHRHLWLQWLPSSEMKSYFCFQITDCQSNKWICSHQRCEIDILFSNFNLYSYEGGRLYGAATHTIVLFFLPPC